MPGGRGVTDDLGRLIVSQIHMSNRATPSENVEICLTQIARQIRDLWYHYVIGPCETAFR